MMRFTVIGALVWLFVCGDVHGFGDVDVDGVSMAIQETMGIISGAGGRALKGLRGMPKGIPAGSLQISPLGRRILQNQDGRCVWEDGKCSVSDTTVATIMTDSTSPTAMFAKDILSCRSPKTERSCKANGCTWNFKECSPSILGNNSYKKCAGGLSLLLTSANQNKDCLSNYLTETQCNTQDKCIWIKNECRVDEWVILLGIPSQQDGQPQGSTEAVQQRASELVQVNRNSKELSEMDPSGIFTWVPPKFQCPTSIDKRVCGYAQVAVDEGFRAGFYCGRRYKIPGPECDQDPVCTSHDFKCGVAQSAILKGAGDAIKTLLATIPDLKLQNAILPIVLCPEHPQEACLGVCAWNELDSKCFATDVWIFEQLAKAANESTDPMCKPVSTFLMAGCAGLGDAACSVNPECEWDSKAGECSLAETRMIQMFAENDPSLSTLQTAWKECTSYETQIECSLLL